MSFSVFILSVYHPCITMSNLNYLFSREVFIHAMLWAIWFFHWTTCQIWSTYRPLKLWDWGTRFTIVARLVFNRLEIVESSASRSLLELVLNHPHDRGQVGPQLLLDRGDAFLIDNNRVGSGLFFPGWYEVGIYRPWPLRGIGKLPTLSTFLGH